jgi:segregation and condensation protein B
MDQTRETPLPEEAEEKAVAAAEPSPLPENPDAPPVADLPEEAGGASDAPEPLAKPAQATADAEPSPLPDNPDAPAVEGLPEEAGGEDTGAAVDSALATEQDYADAETSEAQDDPIGSDAEPSTDGRDLEDAEQLLMAVASEDRTVDEDARRLALLEAIVYVTDEPLSAEQIAKAMNEPLHDVRLLLDRLVYEYNQPQHGLTVKEVAGGYKMATKPEHHEAVRAFVKNLNPPLKLSLAALETLAVIAYKQPITAPEIMEIRGVQGAGVLKTLIDRKLITTAGRKNVVGKPILYKTTKEFLVQFGLRDLNELPTLKEFEDLRRLAFSDGETEPETAPDPAPAS